MPRHPSKTFRHAALAIGLACSIVLVLNAFVSCSTPQTPAPSSGPPVHVGVVIALSGDLQGTGTGLRNAVRVAEQQLNSYGGILGRNVMFDIQDDKTQVDAAIESIVSGLLDQHVSAMLGPIGSQQVLDVQDLMYRAKTIEISATATSVLLTDAQPAVDRYLFRTVPNDTLQAKALAIFAFNGLGPASDAGDSGRGAGATCRKMAILHSDDSYGSPFAAALVPDFEDPSRAGSGAVVTVQTVPAHLKANYEVELEAIGAAKPDCLVLLVFAPTGDEILRELRIKQAAGEIASGLMVIGADGTHTQDFIDNGQSEKGAPSSASVTEGVFGTSPNSNPTTVTGYGDFRNLYLSQYSLDPGETDLPEQAANFYDAAILAALAIEKAGSTSDSVRIRDALYAVSKGATTNPIVVGPGNISDALSDLRQNPPVDINYEGASGSCDFDQFGDVVGGYIIWKVVHPVCGSPNTCPPAFQIVGTIDSKSVTP